MAIKYDRKVAISGRSMVNNTAMAFELGYLHAPENIIVDIESIHRYRPEELVIVTTGSQGEPMSALSRMSGGSHRNVRVGQGDFIIISATPIPGNEKMVTKVVNSLLRLGAEVIYESMYDVHTSGHAYQEEEKLMISMVKPRFFIPVTRRVQASEKARDHRDGGRHPGEEHRHRGHRGCDHPHAGQDRDHRRGAGRPGAGGRPRGRRCGAAWCCGTAVTCRRTG